MKSPVTDETFCEYFCGWGSWVNFFLLRVHSFYLFSLFFHFLSHTVEMERELETKHIYRENELGIGLVNDRHLHCPQICDRSGSQEKLEIFKIVRVKFR